MLALALALAIAAIALACAAGPDGGAPATNAEPAITRPEVERLLARYQAALAACDRPALAALWSPRFADAALALCHRCGPLEAEIELLDFTGTPPAPTVDFRESVRCPTAGFSLDHHLRARLERRGEGGGLGLGELVGREEEPSAPGGGRPGSGSGN